MTIKINGKEISKLLTTVDMTQGDRSIRHCINNLLEALADKEEPNTNNLAVGEKAKEVCSELTEDMHTAINARLQGGYKESQNGKMFYNLQCFGVNIIRDGEQKNTKPSKPSKKAIQNKAEEEEDLPF